MNIIKNIIKWIWNLRNRFSFWVMMPAIYYWNLLLLCYLKCGRAGGEALIAGYILIFFNWLLSLPFFLLEQIFKKLRFPDWKIFKVLHVWNLINFSIAIIFLIYFIIAIIISLILGT